MRADLTPPSQVVLFLLYVCVCDLFLFLQVGRLRGEFLSAGYAGETFGIYK